MSSSALYEQAFTLEKAADEINKLINEEKSLITLGLVEIILYLPSSYMEASIKMICNDLLTI